ncbi:MAG: hypothetical protein V4543_17890 [Bacteroidota bacterium]
MNEDDNSLGAKPVDDREDVGIEDENGGKDTIVRKIIDQYLRDFFKFIKEFDQIESAGPNVYAKKQEVVDRFNAHTGIVGGAMIYARDISKSIGISTQNNYENDPEIKHPINIAWNFSEVNTQEPDLLNHLMQGIIHSTAINKSFNAHSILKYPKYFQNLPPNTWTNSFERPKFEQKLIKEQNINYLICLAGEVIFFNYAWRFLSRCAIWLDPVKDPLNYNEPPSGAGIRKEFPANGTAWFFNEEVLNQAPDLPENDLLRILNDDKYSECKAAWDKNFEDSDLYYTDSIFDIETEWRHLGLSAIDTEPNECRIVAINFIQFFSFCHDIFSAHEIDQILPDDFQYLSDLKEIDKYVPERKSKGADDLAIQVVSGLDKEKIHSAFTKCILALLGKAINKSADTIGSANYIKNHRYSAVHMLSVLHAYSRFPIIAGYVLTFLRKNPLVFDYFVFPVLESDTYTVKSENYKHLWDSKCHNKIVLMMAFIEPIWANKAFLDANYVLKHETMETVEGFKLNQLFYSKISREVIDSGFYDNYVKESIVAKERSDSIFSLRHDTKEYINLVQGLIKKENFVGAKNGLAELKEYMMLADFWFNPDCDLREYEKNSDHIVFNNMIEHVIEIIEYDLVETKGQVLKVSHTIIGLLKEKIVNKELFEITNNATHPVYGLKIVLQIIFKDIIINAVKNAFELKPDGTVPGYPYSKPVKIILENTDIDPANGVKLTVINHARMNMILVAALNNTKKWDRSASNSLGLELIWKYCNALGYKLKADSNWEGEFPVTTVCVQMKNMDFNAFRANRVFFM